MVDLEYEAWSGHNAGSFTCSGEILESMSVYMASGIYVPMFMLVTFWDHRAGAVGAPRQRDHPKYYLTSMDRQQQKPLVMFAVYHAV